MRRLCHWARRANQGREQIPPTALTLLPARIVGFRWERASGLSWRRLCVRMTGLEPARPCGDTDTSSQRVYHSATCANKTDSGVTIVRILPPFSAGVSASWTVNRPLRVKIRCAISSPLSSRDRGQKGPLPARRLPHRRQLAIRLVTARSGHDPDFQEHARRCAPWCPQRDSNSRPPGP